MAGGKGGGAWKVAYADFVTAMMAFFLVMWLLGYDEETRQAIADYFKGVEHAESQNTRGEGTAPEFLPRIVPPDIKTGQRILDSAMLRQAAERLAEAFHNSPELSDDIVRFEFLADGMRITVVDRGNRPLFEPGTAVLTRLGEWILRSIAWQIERFPLDVELEGHVQAGAENADGVGWRLSSERAESAREALQRHGIAAGRFWRVVGHADRKPLDPDHPEAEENRRIAVLVRLHTDDDAQVLREALAVQ